MNVIVTKGTKDTMEMFAIGIFTVAMLLLGIFC